MCWIGIKALYAAAKGVSAPAKVSPAKHKRTLRNAYFEGLFTNAFNPKVSMFYLAAFPQFITVEETSAASSFLLVFIHSTMNAIWFGAMVLLLARLNRFARNGSFQRWLKGLTGVVFVGFGVKLASYRPNI